MSGLLGQIFSAGNVAKRQLRDLLGNPVLGAQQMAGNLNDRARNLNEMTAAAAREGMDYGPATQRLAGLMADAYNPVGMFIGASSPMFNKQMAFEATKLSKQGKSPQEIWQATGTVKGPDGQWRQEISDDRSKFNFAKDIQARKQQIESEISANKEMLDIVKQRGKEAKDLFPKELTQAKKELKGKTESLQGSVSDFYGYGADPRMTGNYANVALEHPELFEAYPELAQRIVFQGRKSGDDGMYGSLYGNQIDVTAKGLLNNPRSTALHEVQHAIQDIEGFGVGGTARDFARMRYQADQQIGVLNDKMREIVRQMDNPATTQSEKTLLRNQYEDLMNERSSLVSTAQIDPMEAYRSLMGEAESRLTQRRMDLTPEQRKQFFPFEYTGETGYGLDVPLEGLIQMDADGTIIRRGLLGR
jgi:hypothetical protein